MIWMLPDQIQSEQDVESVVVVVDFVYTMIFHPFYPFIEHNTREWWFFFSFFFFSLRWLGLTLTLCNTNEKNS